MSRRSLVWVPVALLVCGPLGGCGAPADEDVPPGVELADRPDQETWDVDLALSMEGRPRAQVRAPYLARYDRPDSTYALFQSTPPGDSARVRVVVYDEAGVRSGTVAADRLYYYEDDRRFEAEGRVVVETVEGKRLESEQLVWDEEARSLHTDGFVRITTPEERLQGYELVADENLDTYRLARITGQVTVEDA